MSYEGWRTNTIVKNEAFIEKGYNPIGVNSLPIQEIGEWKVDEGSADVTEVEMRDYKKIFKIEASEPSLITINIHYFPGWKAYLGGKETSIVPSKDHYFLNIEVPEGEHLLEVKFTNTPIRSIANIISLFSLSLVGLLFGYFLKSCLAIYFHTIYNRFAKTSHFQGEDEVEVRFQDSAADKQRSA